MFWTAEEETAVKADRNTSVQEIKSKDSTRSAQEREKDTTQHHFTSRWSVMRWLIIFISRLIRSQPARIISNWQKSFLDFNSQPTNTCRRRNKIIPITSKIRDRHLQLEPLCCVSSCLVRCGCTAVAVFEYIYVGLTLIAIILRLFKNGCFVFWSPIKMSYDSVLTHAYFAYVLLGYDLITLAMSTALLHALTNFDKQILRLHLYFDYFALIFNTVLLLILLPALILQKSELRTFSNTLMAFCLLSQIPLQIWAITVVRSCLQFFVLVHVLVRLAEK